MSWIGVITGDIVNSTEILNSGERDKLLEVLYGTVEEINKKFKSSDAQLKIEIYRGDSFQLIINKSWLSLVAAIIIRASLIENSNKKMRWDARLGIGIGEGKYIADKIAESDGEAFRLSGRAFDGLDKNNRLSILTPNDDFNEELDVTAAFADDIISNWTATQASAISRYWLTSTSQKELAKSLKKTPQAVSKLLSAGKTNLLVKFENRFLYKTYNIKIIP